jgi:hypothetical protein
MAKSSTIIETAPLHGVDLTVTKPRLPHDRPAPVATVRPDQVDRSGTLAAPQAAAQTVSAWKDIRDYTIPPRLDPLRTDLAGEREQLAHDSVDIVSALQKVSAQHDTIDRGFQRKTLYVTTSAEFRVPVNLPASIVAGPFRPGAKHRAIVRFSSASSKAQPDPVPDQRAVGVRITDDGGHIQDLTFTSGSAGNHARDARQFNSSMIAARHLAAGGILGRVRAIVGLLSREGIRETRRLNRARRDALDSGVSLAAIRYYSRSPVELGRKLVHLALLPVEGTVEELVHDARGARDGLGRDLLARRAAGDVRFRLAAAEAPGLDDMTVPPTGPWITIAEIRLPMQRTSETEMLRLAGRIHGELAMHPFNLWEAGALKPRGELNEILRKPVYIASARNSGRVDEPPAAPDLGI